MISRVHQPNESWGFPKFCQRGDILDAANMRSMLPEGTLTVHCEIRGFKRITTRFLRKLDCIYFVNIDLRFLFRSDFSRVREKFKSESFNDLSKDLNDAFASMDHADVVLICQGQEFPCHKFMLSAR